jgi:predicted secreted protein
MAKDVGSLVFLTIEGKLLVGQTSLSYSSACDMIDISSKDSGRHREFAAGKISKTFSVSGIGSTTKEATNEGYFELEAKQDAGLSVPFVITKYTDETATTPVEGDESKAGTAFISNLNYDANDNEAISFSADFQITGKPTGSTNPATP